MRDKTKKFLINQ